MPRIGQIIPKNRFPHRLVVINDNTEIFNIPSSDSGETRMLFVFASPRGRDRQVITIDDGAAGFLNEYGIGPFALYGQPLMNAYASALSGAATLHCLRVTADNATYSSITIQMKYKADPDTKMLQVKFSPVSFPGVTIDEQTLGLTDLNLLKAFTESEPNPKTDEDGWTTVNAFSIAYQGRSSLGNNYRWRIVDNIGSNKENPFVNYIFELYINEGGLRKIEEYAITIPEDAEWNGVSLNMESVITDPDGGSNTIVMKTNPAAFEEIFEAYKMLNPETIYTINDFDFFRGIDKYTRKQMENYEIVITGDDDAIDLTNISGIGLKDGSDGDLAAPKTPQEVTARQEVLTQLYIKAFSGDSSMDPMIKSKNKFPTNIILDANFDVKVKPHIAALTTVRSDCICFLDCGTGITTKSSVLPYIINNNFNSYVVNRVHAVEAYCGKTKDMYNNKVVTVTGTYPLAAGYPIHFQNNNGKHVPLAGNVFGIINGFIKNSIYPVFDEDLDEDLMNELTDNNINFARNNARSIIVRAIQNTRQQKLSVLSDLNNVFILLDIKRDCERLCALYEYNFMEAEDISRFNADAETLLSSYRDYMVRSIRAEFDSNPWEAARGILHMYVEFVCKDIVKTTIIEIDTNRS